MSSIQHLFPLATSARRLPHYKVPAAFEFRPEPPHSRTGKVHKLTFRRAERIA